MRILSGPKWGRLTMDLDWPAQDREARFRDILLCIYRKWNIEITTFILLTVLFRLNRFFFIIQLLFVDLWALNFNFFFFFIEWSAGSLISAFSVNGGFSCLGLKIYNVGRRLVQLRFDLPPGKVSRRWSSERLGDIRFLKTIISPSKNYFQLIVCLFGFYGISTFVGYLMPNPF